MIAAGAHRAAVWTWRMQIQPCLLKSSQVASGTSDGGVSAGSAQCSLLLHAGGATRRRWTFAFCFSVCSRIARKLAIISSACSSAIAAIATAAATDSGWRQPKQALHLCLFLEALCAHRRLAIASEQFSSPLGYWTPGVASHAPREQSDQDCSPREREATGAASARRRRPSDSHPESRLGLSMIHTWTVRL